MASVDDIINDANESAAGYDPSVLRRKSDAAHQAALRKAEESKGDATDADLRDAAQVGGATIGAGAGAVLGNKVGTKLDNRTRGKQMDAHASQRAATGKAVPRAQYSADWAKAATKGKRLKVLSALVGAGAGALVGHEAGEKGHEVFGTDKDSSVGKSVVEGAGDLGGFAAGMKLAGKIPVPGWPGAILKGATALGSAAAASGLAGAAYDKLFGEDPKSTGDAETDAARDKVTIEDKAAIDAERMYTQGLAQAKADPNVFRMLQDFAKSKDGDPEERKIAQRIVNELTGPSKMSGFKAKDGPTAPKVDEALNNATPQGKVEAAQVAMDTPGMGKLLEDVNKNEAPGPEQLEKFEDRYEEAIHRRIKNIESEVDYFREIMRDESKSPSERQAAMREASMREDAGLSLMAIARGFDREREIRGEKDRKFQFDPLLGHPKEKSRLHSFLDTLNNVMLLMGAGGFGWNGNIEGVKLMGDSYKLGGSPEQRDRDRAELQQIIADRSNLGQGAQARYANLESMQLGKALEVNTEEQLLPLKRALISAQTGSQLAVITGQMRANIQNAVVDVKLKQQAAEFVAELENSTAERRIELFDRLMAMGPAGEQILKIIGGSMINNAGGIVGGTLNSVVSDKRAKNVYWQYDHSPEIGEFMDTAMGRNKKEEEPKKEEKKRIASYNRPKDTKKMWGRAAESVRGWA